MGKNNGNSWLNAVKKAFRSPVKEDIERKSSRRREENEQQEEEEKKRGKRRWIFRKPLPLETTIQHNEGSNSPAIACANNAVREGICVTKQAKLDNSVASRQRRDGAVVRPSDIIRLTRPVPFLTRENEAALVIQAIFRGYLARRALLALKGVVKLQALIRGHNVRKRAKMTLQCIQSLVRVQAQVCDQRRRLSCESTIFNQGKTSRNSTSRNASNTSIELDESQCTLEEIQDLIEKAKECSLRRGKTLAHALSQQMRGFDESRFSDYNQEVFEEEPRHSGRNTSHQWVRKDRNLCIQRDPIKTVEIDTSRPYSFTSPNSNKSRSQHRLHHEHEQYLDSYFMPSPLLKKHHNHNLSVSSPKTPSSKIRSIQLHSSSPHCQREERNCHTAETPTLRSNYFRRMSISENSDSGARPNYMAATASATARVRSQSAPNRPSSPNREHTGSSKKRLSFPMPEQITK